MNKTNQIIKALCYTALALLTPAAFSQSANSGRILDEDGKPIPNAIVHIQTQNGAADAKRADAASDGAFSTAALPDGTHNVCVHMPETSYINACLWSNSPPTITVVKGNITGPNKDITVQRGVTLKLRVNDPGGNLTPKVPSKTQPPSILAGLWSETRRFYPMRIAASDAGGSTYQLTVPYESDMKLTVNGSALLVSLQKGAQADASKLGAAVAVRIPRGTTPGVITADIAAPVIAAGK